VPPNVPSLETQDPQTVENLTLRQRTELHRKDPTCASCHKVLDPIGFGLENFDAIGQWRATDAGHAIDAHTIQPYYAGLLAAECGLTVSIAAEGDAIVVAAR